MGWFEVERSPAALRQALQDKGAELFVEAVRHLDGVLMGEEDVECRTTITLPGGLRIVLTASLDLVQP